MLPSSSALTPVTQPVTYFGQTQDKPLALSPYLEKLQQAQEASAEYVSVKTGCLLGLFALG